MVGKNKQKTDTLVHQEHRCHRIVCSTLNVQSQFQKREDPLQDLHEIMQPPFSSQRKATF